MQEQQRRKGQPEAPVPLEKLFDRCLEHRLVESWQREEGGSFQVNRDRVTFHLKSEQVRGFLETLLGRGAQA